MAMLCQEVICNSHLKRDIPPLCVVLLLKKLLLIIYKTKVMYMPACWMQQKPSTKLVLLNYLPYFSNVIFQLLYFGSFLTYTQDRVWLHPGMDALLIPSPLQTVSRQGGVLSPILFNVYMDELIDKLKINNVGCHIGRQFTGAFCYADDLTLLSPTIRGLQKMLNVCDAFANEYSVKFNARKTVCMCFSRKPTCRDINVLLSGEKLHWSNHVKHLGNTLSHNLSDEIDVQVKRGHFYGLVNTVCAKFKCVLGDLDLATKLFMSYFCSFYGSQLWDLSSTWFDAICVAWNKAVRRIFQLPYNTHRFLLPYVVDGNPIRDQLLKRCVKFYESCDESKNSIIQLLVSNANFENTPMGINMRYIAMHFKSKVKVNSEKDGAGHLLHSLLKIREQYWEISEFTREKVECMIYNVCTS